MDWIKWTRQTMKVKIKINKENGEIKMNLVADIITFNQLKL